MSETDAKKRPPKLFLPDIFLNKYIYYTYPEYKQHVDETFEFAANTANSCNTDNCIEGCVPALCTALYLFVPGMSATLSIIRRGR